MNFGELFARLFLIYTTSETLTSTTTPSTRATTQKDVGKIPFTIYVEGNVGCGKSTFLELFEGDDRVQIVQVSILYDFLCP